MTVVMIKNKVTSTFTSTYRNEVEGPVKEKKHGVHHRDGKRESERERRVTSAHGRPTQTHNTHNKSTTDSKGSSMATSQEGSTKLTHSGKFKQAVSIDSKAASIMRKLHPIHIFLVPSSGT